MTDLEKSLASLQQHLSAMLNEHEDEFSDLIATLEEALSAAEKLSTVADDRGRKVKRLEQRARGQNNVIETLSEEAGESHGLRFEVRERELEIARLKRELDAKNGLIAVLRNQLRAQRAAGGHVAEEAALTS